MTFSRPQEAEAVIDDNNVVEIEGTDIALESYIHDKVIMLVDKYKSGYECKECGGTGKLLSTLEFKKGTYVDCHACGGKGGILIIPENRQQFPNTGIIMSIGPDCTWAKVGDHVIIGPHTGQMLPIKSPQGQVSFMVFRESEILTRLYSTSGKSLDSGEVIDMGKGSHYTELGI